MSLRNERVRKELMRDISDIIRQEIRGLSGVVSIIDDDEIVRAKFPFVNCILVFDSNP